MDKPEAIALTIFWSWQSDSNAWANRNFIGDCLARATAAVQREDAVIISVDRDTSGVGGSPSVAETIFKKIRSADVFVWDASLINAGARPTPNPNVLIEYGYALALLGDGRLIGVMNTAGRGGPEQLPFDLKHKRWPITYSLSAPSGFAKSIGTVFPRAISRYHGDRERARKALVADLTNAIRAAVNEPKRGAIRSDVDFHAARRLWSVINSRWLMGWYHWRIDNPQFEHVEDMNRIREYVHVANQPEYVFEREHLHERHAELLTSLNRYSHTAALEMVPQGPDMYVISAKKADWSPEMDQHYDRQCKVLVSDMEKIWAAWQQYVDELRSLYPEIVASDEPVAQP